MIICTKKLKQKDYQVGKRKPTWKKIISK